MTSLRCWYEAQCLVVCSDSNDKRPHLVPDFLCSLEVPGENSSVQTPKSIICRQMALQSFPSFITVAIPESSEEASRAVIAVSAVS